jgi:hypothetical protein
MKNFTEKIRKLLASLHFIFMFLILILAIFFSILGNFRVYKSEISIIVIPKSPALMAQSESVVQNFEALPKTLSFYNRILKDNSSIKDQFAEQSDAQRKKNWNKNLSVKREGNSQVINFIVYSRNNDANIIARQTASSLFSLATQYYNLKTDLDLRIIDGPINSSYLGLWFVPIIISLIFGFILAFFASYIFSFFSRLANEPKVSNLFKNIEDKFKFEKNSNLSLEDLGIAPLEKSESQKEAGVEQKTETYVKNASAPANLPIALEHSLFEKQPPLPSFESEKISGRPKTEAEPKKGEPSEDEIKSRLNKLLKGEL